MSNFPSIILNSSWVSLSFQEEKKILYPIVHFRFLYNGNHVLIQLEEFTKPFSPFSLQQYRLFKSNLSGLLKKKRKLKGISHLKRKKNILSRFSFVLLFDRLKTLSFIHNSCINISCLLFDKKGKKESNRNYSDKVAERMNEQEN